MQVQVVDAQTPFVLGDKQVTPIAVMHNKLPVLGYRIDNFAYLTDVKTIAKEELHKLHNLDCLVLSALRVAPHDNHLNLAEALDLIEKINPKQAYLTHISHLMGFHQEVSQQLPNGVALAYDMLSIQSS